MRQLDLPAPWAPVAAAVLGLSLLCAFAPRESRGEGSTTASPNRGLEAGSGAEASPLSDGAAFCSRSRRESARLRAEGRSSVPGGALPGEKAWSGPTPNQLRWDARSYDIRLLADPAEKRLSGSVTMTGTVVSGPLSRVDLDLDDAMAVTGAAWPGVADTLHAVHEGGFLHLSLPQPLQEGEEFRLQISYEGVPRFRAFNFSTQDGQPMIWTLSAPDGARLWWPCKDHPQDKADSVDVTLTVPSGLLATGNGVLRETSDDGTWATFHWHEGHPVSTYLVSVTAYPYHFYSDTYVSAGGDSMPILFYNFESSLDTAEPVQRKVKEMMAGYAALFGEYPFLDEKYGHAEFLFNGGMENQTLTSLGSYGEYVVAHELSHQWWGDDVTCRDFHDVWLNEGFATYCEALWAKIHGGARAYHAKMALTRYLGAGTLWVPELANSDRIYSLELSYYKGSWVVHMLRHVVGDESFFPILREYRDRHAGGVATTDDLRSVAEEISGRDLGPFFEQWVMREGFPLYNYEWSASPSGQGYDLTLRLRQLQAGEPFVMPVDVTVLTESGEETFRVENDSADQSYTLAVSSNPREVILDRDEWILRRIIPPLGTPEFSRSCLLVNGMPWQGLTAPEVRAAYDAQAFGGQTAYDFWDAFEEPADGYPSTLPAPLGHGAVPDSVLRRYQTVLWLANNSGGDTEIWQDTPVFPYLEAGGNVLLLGRSLSTLLTEPFRAYLGVSWAGVDTVYDWTSGVAGLPDLRATGVQSSVSWFAPEVGGESSLLYKSANGHVPEWGVGILRSPAQGGTYNARGGRFAVISGRPYRWNYQDLREGIEFILSTFMPQQVAPGTPLSLEVAPNPLSSGSMLRFLVPAGGEARLAIYDARGRRVRLLRDGPSVVGWNGAFWDGRDDHGNLLAPGVYFSRVRSSQGTREQKVVILR